MQPVVDRITETFHQHRQDFIYLCKAWGRSFLKMFRPFFMFWIILNLSLSIVLTQQARNSQWFEETIDEFLRNAQDNGEATDIQVSTCKISSQQLVATAQATAARVLKGVCNPSEIEGRFKEMEVQLGDQLNSLKTLLGSIEDKITEQDNEIKRNHRRTMSLLAGMKKPDVNASGGIGGGSTVIENSGVYTPAYIPSVPHRAEEVVQEVEDVEETTTESSAAGQQIGSGNGLNIKSGQIGPRSDEMIKYNSTVHIENGKRVFSYYWVVTGVASKLSNWNQKRILRSNSFYIYPRGYRMFMKIIPRYTSSTMYIHTGITKGDYDESLEWPFSYKMKVQVLDQDETKTRHLDLKSRLWDPKELCSGTNWRKPLVGDNPECVGLGFPHNVIQTPDYIWNDRIIIKLTVHLD